MRLSSADMPFQNHFLFCISLSAPVGRSLQSLSSRVGFGISGSLA